MDHGFFDGPWQGGMATGGRGGLALLKKRADMKRAERLKRAGLDLLLPGALAAQEPSL